MKSKKVYHLVIIFRFSLSMQFAKITCSMIQITLEFGMWVNTSLVMIFSRLTMQSTINNWTWISLCSFNPFSNSNQVSLFSLEIAE